MKNLFLLLLALVSTFIPKRVWVGVWQRSDAVFDSDGSFRIPMLLVVLIASVVVPLLLLHEVANSDS